MDQRLQDEASGQLSSHHAREEVGSSYEKNLEHFPFRRWYHIWNQHVQFLDSTAVRCDQFTPLSAPQAYRITLYSREKKIPSEGSTDTKCERPELFLDASSSAKVFETKRPSGRDG